MISEKNQILINRILDTIDWGLIYKFYKLIGRTIGQETTQIPGIKKLDKGVKLQKDHIKEEVRSLINHVVENDLSQFTYGPWNFTWINGEWEIEMDEDEDGNPLKEGQKNYIPISESILEIQFSPMVVIGRELINDFDEEDEEEIKDEINLLQKQLEKAITNENYELATKIRDLIEIYKKQK